MKIKYLVLPAYLVAALLVLFPIIDTVVGLWPFRFGEVRWRFGTIGLFSRAVMTPALGVLLVFAVALFFEHRKTLRTLAFAAGFIVLSTLISVPLFILDGLQLRSTVRPDMKVGFDVSMVIAIVKMLAGIVVFGAFAFYAWRASRKDPAVIRAETRTVGGAGLVGR